MTRTTFLLPANIFGKNSNREKVGASKLLAPTFQSLPSRMLKLTSSPDQTDMAHRSASFGCHSRAKFNYGTCHPLDAYFFTSTLKSVLELVPY